MLCSNSNHYTKILSFMHMNKRSIQGWKEKYNPLREIYITRTDPQITSYSLLKRIPFGLEKPWHLEILKNIYQIGYYCALQSQELYRNFMCLRTLTKTGFVFSTYPKLVIVNWYICHTYDVLLLSISAFKICLTGMGNGCIKQASKQTSDNKRR